MINTANIFIRLSLITFTLLLLAIVILPASRASAQTARGNCNLQKSGIFGLPTWYKYLPGELEDNARCSPVIDYKDVNSLLPIGIAVLEIALRLSGVVAVVMVFIGAFKFVTSTGNSDAAAGGRKTIINALIGLIIVVIATSVVNYLGNRLSRSPVEAMSTKVPVALININEG